MSEKAFRDNGGFFPKMGEKKQQNLYFLKFHISGKILNYFKIQHFQIWYFICLAKNSSPRVIPFAILSLSFC